MKEPLNVAVWALLIGYLLPMAVFAWGSMSERCVNFVPMFVVAMLIAVPCIICAGWFIGEAIYGR